MCQPLTIIIVDHDEIRTASSLEIHLLCYFTRRKHTTRIAKWLSIKNIYLILHPVLLVKYATQNQIDPVYISCEISPNLLSNKYTITEDKYMMTKSGTEKLSERFQSHDIIYIDY